MSSEAFPKIISIDNTKCNLSNPNLQYDEACLLVSSTAQSIVKVFAQNVECIGCDLKKWASIDANISVPLLIKSRYNVLVDIRGINNTSLCTLNQKFGERGLYQLDFNDTACGDLVTLREPDSAELPLLILMVVFGGILLIASGVQQLLSSNWFKQITLRTSHAAELENDLGSPTVNEAGALVNNVIGQRKLRARIKSLDTFRGICIALMIFVNYGGGKYTYFEHSIWNGLTVADVLFPSFMWIMGVSLVLSMRSQLRSGITRRKLMMRIVTRGCKLILLGAILNSSNGRNSLASYRVCGVLQRLGICYIIVAAMEAYKLQLQTAQRTTLPWLQDLRDAWPQWLITLLLVAVHTAVTFALPVLGCPTGYLGPGGLHMHGEFANCTGGAAGYVDRLIVGQEHMYPNPTCKKVYHTTVSYDPEGVLGLLTGVLLVQLGAQAGRVLLTYNNSWSRVSRWLAWALVTAIAGGALSGFSQEGGVIPVNKNLNSLSFTLVNAAIDFLVLAVVYLLVDVKRWWTGAPFYFVGMNSLLLYVAHGFTNNMLPWKWQPLGSSHAELLAMDAWAATLWILIAYYLFAKNVFITV